MQSKIKESHLFQTITSAEIDYLYDFGYVVLAFYGLFHKVLLSKIYKPKSLLRFISAVRLRYFCKTSRCLLYPVMLLITKVSVIPKIGSSKNINIYMSLSNH